MPEYAFVVTTVRLVINYTWIGLNALASLFTLYLLRCNNKENEYNNIIYHMTIAQFLFDFSFSLKYRGVIDQNTSTFNVIYNAIDLAFSSSAGIATGCYALVICAIMCRIVVSMNYIDLVYYKKLIVITTSFLSFSFFVGILIPELLHSQESHNVTKEILVTEGEHVHPVYLLAQRLFLYPVVQFMTRMPIFVYLLNYGSYYDYYQESHPSYFQTMTWFVTTISLPFGGIGNFIAFYVANSYCKEIIYNIFHCKSNKYDNEVKPDVIKIKSIVLEQMRDTMRDTNIDNIDRLSVFKDGDDLYRETNALFRETQINVDDFDLDYLYDEYGTYKDVDLQSLNEEQLCRHIACLNKIKSISIELKKTSLDQKYIDNI